MDTHIRAIVERLEIIAVFLAEMPTYYVKSKQEKLLKRLHKKRRNKRSEASNSVETCLTSTWRNAFSICLIALQ